MQNSHAAWIRELAPCQQAESSSTRKSIPAASLTTPKQKPPIECSLNTTGVVGGRRHKPVGVTIVGLWLIAFAAVLGLADPGQAGL